MNYTLKDVIGWYYFGTLEGYPECCINEFITDCMCDMSPAKKRGATRYGFVPCSKCLPKWIGHPDYAKWNDRYRPVPLLEGLSGRR